MRQLLSTQPRNRAFSSTTIRNLLKNKSAQINHHDANHSFQFEKHLRQTILSHELRKEKVDTQLSEHYKKIVMTSAKPAETLLKDFLDKSKAYTEEQMTATVFYLSKAFQLSRIDNDRYLDANGPKLYASEYWENMIEEIKYGLSSFAYISFPNLTKIIKSLTNMGYLDIEIVKLVIDKIETRLNIESADKMFNKFDNDQWKRYYQINKRDYYKSRKVGIETRILESPEFKNNMKIFEGKLNEILERKKNIELIPKEDFDCEEEYNNVVKLLDTLNQFMKSAGSMAEAIITIRKQYAQMCSISHEDKVLRNPSLNYDLLDIQEQLLDLQFITIHDIQDPGKILDNSENGVNQEHIKVEGILKNILEKYKIISYENFVSFFSHNNQEKDFSASEELIKSIRDEELVQLLSAFARYVNLESVLYGTKDTVSMINVKWQKYFIHDKIIHDKLPVQRIFRKAFAESHSFILKNQPLIEFEVFQSKFSTKIYWYDALLQLGIYKDMFVQLASCNISPSIVKTLEDNELVLFVNILSSSHSLILNEEINTNGFEISAETHEAIMEKLLALPEKLDRSWLTYRELVGILNYMYLNNLKTGKYQELYQFILTELDNEVKDLTDVLENDYQLKLAQKTLIIQKCGQYESPANFNLAIKGLADERETQSTYYNPFLKAVKDVSKKISTSNQPDIFSGVFPFIFTGFNYSSNLPTAIYLIESDYSSLDGVNIANGNILANCQRIKEKFNIEVEPVSINKFLDITYYTEDYKYRPVIKMKPVDEIMEILNGYFDRGNTKLKKFADDCIEAILRVAEKSSRVEDTEIKAFRVKARKIINSLQKLVNITRLQKNSITPEQARLKKYELLMTFDLFLKTDLKTLTAEQKKEIESELKSMSSLENSQEAKGIDQIIQEIEQEIKSVIEGSLSNKTSSNVDENFKKFIGKRLTLDYLLEEKGEINLLPEAEIMNESYFLDHEYVQYSDWETKIKEVTICGQIDLGESTNPSTVKFLAMKYLPNIKNSIVTIPTTNNQMLTTTIPLNWENLYFYNNNANNGKAKENRQIDLLAQTTKQLIQKKKVAEGKDPKDLHELNYLIHLQNLKHELKINKSLSEVCQYIMKFQFIDNLIDEHLSNEEADGTHAPHFVSRDPEAYFAYLSRKSTNSFTESPYLEYIFSKMEQIQNLKDLLKERKHKKIDLQRRFQTGQITKEYYFNTVKSFDLDIIEIMKKTLSKKLVAHSHSSHSSIMTDPSKIIQLVSDLNEIERIVSKKTFYNLEVDEDYIVSEGNVEETLNKKRSRAEVNLILYRIIYKSAKGETLSEKENTFLKEWSQKLSTNLKENKFTCYNKFSKLPIKKVSNHDRAHLSMQYTNFMKHCGDLALNDLVLQLNHFLDDRAIVELQKKIIKKNYEGKFDPQILEHLLAKTQNKTFDYYSHRMQQNIMSSSSKLNEVDLKNLMEMTKIFKTEGFYTNEQYKVVFKDLEQTIRFLNENEKNSQFRVVAISQYLKKKDWQFYNRYNPQAIASLKQRETVKLWHSIFNKDISETTSPQLKKQVDEICKRMVFFKKNLPPYFSYLILNILAHEKTPTLCKQKLLAYIQKFNIVIDIDSEDIMKIIKSNKQGDNNLDSERLQIEKQLKRASQIDNDSLGKKILGGLI